MALILDCHRRGIHQTAGNGTARQQNAGGDHVTGNLGGRSGIMSLTII